MNYLFEQIINSYLETNIGQSLDFLSKTLSDNLKLNLLNLNQSKQLNHAGIGLKDSFQSDKLYRSDKTRWLETTSTNKYEIDFFQLIDSFVLFLNQTCYTGITNYEFHYTIYEPGCFYKRHIDKFAANDSRVFSIIIYLNENWLEGDGGELMIYNKEKDNEIIKPQNGRMVFFDSAKLEHEVLETNVPRYSITGWLRRD